MISQCNHIFSANELLNWFNSNVRCPMCRYDIRNYVNHSSYMNQETMIRDTVQNNLVTVEDEDEDEDEDQDEDESYSSDSNENNNEILENELENVSSLEPIEESTEDSIDYDSLLNDVSLTRELYNDLYNNNNNNTENTTENTTNDENNDLL